MPVDIVQDAMQVLEGAFLARATYGGEYIDQAFNVSGDDDAEKADDYRGYLASQGNWQLLDDTLLPTFNHKNGNAGFTDGGLYNARVFAGSSSTFDAQGLLAVKDGDTLVLSFRGTDGIDPAVEDGQAFTGAAIAANYKAFKPLINAAYNYLADHPEITDVVVSGHSLGAAVADVFTIVDADRFRALRPDGLTIVSLASSGVPPDLPQFLNGIDPSAATIVQKQIIDIFGFEITVDEIAGLKKPADYISIANTEDRAHFPNHFPDIPEDFGLVPIATLKDNLHFRGDTLFRVPNIDNSDVQYYDVFDHPFDFRGMGAQHNSALLWANLQGLTRDDLFSSYAGQKLVAGITDYNHVPDFDGTSIPLFLGYLQLDNPDIVNDRGARSLIGSQTADYILGLVGRDRMDGQGGNDLLSGGTGADIILGGDGNDIISGGSSADVMAGGAGQDHFHYSNVAQSAFGNADTIRDFKAIDDQIDVTTIDASETTVDDQAFDFIGSAAFTAEGQVRAFQSGADTIVRFNVSGAHVAEMEILLKNFDAATLTDLNFIL